MEVTSFVFGGNRSRHFVRAEATSRAPVPTMSLVRNPRTGFRRSTEPSAHHAQKAPRRAAAAPLGASDHGLGEALSSMGVSGHRPGRKTSIAAGWLAAAAWLLAGWLLLALLALLPPLLLPC